MKLDEALCIHRAELNPSLPIEELKHFSNVQFVAIADEKRSSPDYSRSTKSKLSMLNKLPEKHYFFIIAIDKVDSAHCCLRIASKNILKVRLQRSFFLEGQRLMNNPG